MTRTILEVHALQTVPPSCLNRDDTGTPKSAVYGGVRRARVSSQAWKRATRRSFHDVLDPGELGVRTRKVAELLAERIVRLDGSIEQAQAWALAAETIQTATGSKIETPKRAAKDKQGPPPAPESKYLMFLSAHQLDGLAELAVKAHGVGADHFKDKGVKDLAKRLANSRHSVDIALFGRMVADGADINVDAAAQVAHAISVHRVDNESDYYTAVDDYKNRETDDLGAGMIGTVEFNSATLYRYAAVDVDLLRRNLGKGLRDDEPLTQPVRRAAETFVECFLTSLPTGKINTFGNHTLPEAVVIKIRSTRPVSFVGAFEEPCRTDPGIGGHMRQACAVLADYIPEIEEAYGLRQEVPTWILRVGKNTEALAPLGEQRTLQQLITEIGAEVAQRQDGA
ncbi:type I-E CRISPR-associated protein Cas7/Cse4/CasC [Spongiactinospora rosea]|uniref:Type I-E CRISPR-associated protein Cas7/Cse4/CasC n=1 Tax=Spongiactinospora rosea TaxID=2248750 RepID=A0A366M6L1_9ACTN|nr:type I-E CRISPR-associated protein Cas7/Cse4/CasC [Spongiactinospora rosea]RBQ21169.1 type I-E CRISPR-associated protein Cas7/Cse4/CasC [Spongiactinospora rosea]